MIVSLKDKEGNEIRDKEGILLRIKEFYEELYDGRELEGEGECEDDNEWLEILEDEVRWAIKNTKEGKSEGVDDITMKMIKTIGETVVRHLTRIDLDDASLSDDIGQNIKQDVDGSHGSDVANTWMDFGAPVGPAAIEQSSRSGGKRRRIDDFKLSDYLASNASNRELREVVTDYIIGRNARREVETDRSYHYNYSVYYVSEFYVCI